MVTRLDHGLVLDMLVSFKKLSLLPGALPKIEDDPRHNTIQSGFAAVVSKPVWLRRLIRIRKSFEVGHLVWRMDKSLTAQFDIQYG